MGVPPEHVSALRLLIVRLPLAEINWALTGSTAHALQGVPVEPHDVDVQTDEPSTWKAATALNTYCASTPRRVESQHMRSLLGSYTINGVEVELMGAVQTRRSDHSWDAPTNPADHRRIVQLGDLQIPVLSLKYEAARYEKIGRHERATLLRRHLDVADPDSLDAA